MPELAIYRATTGYNNRITPERLPFSKGVTALEDVSNMLIDKTGCLVTRRAVSPLGSGSYHSSWRVGDSFYAVLDGTTTSTMYYVSVNQVDGSLSLKSAVTNLNKGKRVYYTEPLDGYVYYSNGYQHGKLALSVSSDWTNSEWNLTDRNVNKVEFPIGEHLAILSGRVVTSVGKELIFSEYGHWGLYDEAENRRRFETDITMICSVQTGVYVSDQNDTYFLSGTNPKEWTMKQVLPYPCNGFRQGLVNPFDLGFETPQLSALLSSKKGTIIAMPDGTAINLIEKNVETPHGCGGLHGTLMMVDSTILQS